MFPTAAFALTRRLQPKLCPTCSALILSASAIFAMTTSPHGTSADSCIQFFVLSDRSGSTPPYNSVPVMILTFHAFLHVQETRLQLRLHCRTFHDSNFLMSSNTRLCHSQCLATSSLYSPSDLDDAALPIRVDTFEERIPKIEAPSQTVVICLGTHF